MSRRAFFTVFLTILALITPTASIAAPKVGANCPKVGKTEVLENKRFTCMKAGKRLIWRKGVSIAKPKAIPLDARESAARYAITSQEEFANLEFCKIKSTLTSSGSLGFPRDSTLIPSLGVVRGITLFVEFNDLKDDGNPLRVWRTQQIPTAEDYFTIASYRKMQLKIDLVETVFPINKSVLAYNLDTPHDAPPKPNANANGLVMDAMDAADASVDFSKYDFVNVVTPATKLIGFEGASGIRRTIDGKPINWSTWGPIREYMDAPNKYNWLVHEAGHLLGLLHPYNIKSKPSAGFVFPTWDLMGNSLAENSEFLAWNKFLMGWLDNSQVNCLSGDEKSTTTHLISPLTDNANGVKATVIKLTDTKAIVVENRRKSSLNNLSRIHEGVLAYLVDAGIPDGEGGVRFLYSKLTTNNTGGLIGTLKPGESIKHQNVTVKVLSSIGDGDYVSVIVD